MPLLDLLTDFTQIAPVPLLVAMGVTFLAATLQGTVGFGFSMLSVPVLALFDPRLAPVPQMLVALPLTLPMAIREWGGVDWRGTGWVLLGRLPGAGLGIVLVGLATQRALDLMIAGAIALAVVAAAIRRSATEADRPSSIPLRFGAGVASGTLSYVSAIGGPPLALLYRNASGPTLRATLAVVFSVGLCITITGRTMAGQIGWADLRVAAVLAPFVLLGVVASGRLTGKVEGDRLRGLVLLVAGGAALGLAGRALFG